MPRPEHPLVRAGSPDHHDDVRVTAGVERLGSVLELGYRVDDPNDVVRYAARSEAPARRDRLWEHTCYEAFVSPVASTTYWEINLAPSGDWNVYRFDDYRHGMAPDTARDVAPRIAVDAGGRTLTATLRLDAIPALAAADLVVGLAVVLAHADGTTSYWALAHPRDRPDFHARDGWLLRLPREDPLA